MAHHCALITLCTFGPNTVHLWFATVHLFVRTVHLWVTLVANPFGFSQDFAALVEVAEEKEVRGPIGTLRCKAFSA